MTPDREAVRAALESLLAELTAAARREPVAGAAPSGAAPMEGAVGAVAAVDHPAWAEGPVVLAAGRTHLPGTRPEPPAPVSPATRMDLASVTKVVTALTALRLVEDGVLDLDAPVAETLDGSDPRITARHLLTHTAGFPPTLPLWEAPDREAGLARVRTAAPVTEPGTVHEYSCIGFMRLGLLLEALTARPLPELALTLVLEPTGAAGAHWIGTPRGATHDEAAWALGGVGNAGIHADMAALLAVGRGLADRSPGLALSPASHALLRTDQLPAGVTTGQAWRQGLGVRLDQDVEAPDPAAPVLGHSGFSGATVGAEPGSGVVWALLSNRVHPDRRWFTVEGTRRRLAALALSR